MSWSPQQEAALKAVGQWLRSSPGHGATPQVFRLFGYAGTGKTTLAREFAAGLDGDVAFAAFTGKAAHVMQKKGCVDASTIHSLIYRLDDEQPTEQPRFILNRGSSIVDAALIVIDECSMVDETLGRDLLSFGVPVLVLGDPAQLPPVKGSGFFTEHEPDVMLTEVHRQAEQSPIIRLATMARQQVPLSIMDAGEARVVDRAGVTQDDVLGADQVLVGLNRTRHRFNARIRLLHGHSSDAPEVGERLICLKNDREKHLLNGSAWTVSQVRKRTHKDARDEATRLAVLSEDAVSGDKATDIRVLDAFWHGRETDLSWQDKRGTDEFTFGYAITCHKAQGSQWNRVTIFDEASTFRDDAWRWRYTAITRAAESLTVVLP